MCAACRLHTQRPFVCFRPIGFYGNVPVACPLLVYLTAAFGGLCWCHTVYAPVRALVVVEVYGFCHGPSHILRILERHSPQEFVLDCAVDSLGYGIVLGVPPFGHTYADAVALQKPCVSEACVLQPSVGVVDELGEFFPLIAAERHFEGFYRIAGLKAVAHAVAYNLAAVAVCHKGQEAEAAVRIKRDVGDVAGHKLAGMRGDELAREVRVKRKPVTGVRGGGATLATADLQTVELYDVVEAVVADAVIVAEALAVHDPQLAAAYAGVPGTDFMDEFNHEAFKGKTGQMDVDMLVEGLLAHTK